MQDDEVEALLLSDERLVLIEAPAGCGKTYQGAKYADVESGRLPSGKVLILTHTHAACGVFSERTKSNKQKVEIKTIDSLIVQIASAYHKILDLPNDVSSWARSNNNGFDELAKKVSALVSKKTFISKALVSRFPVVICDEHQDASVDQHRVILELYGSGAKLRVFGDPMQALYADTNAKMRQNTANWDELKKLGSHAELEFPHRWSEGEIALGYWILEARKSLRNHKVIDLTGVLPAGLNIVIANNVSKHPRRYQLDRVERRPIDYCINAKGKILVLASTKSTVESLRSAFGRRLIIWEGYVRGALSELILTLSAPAVSPAEVAQAAVTFIGQVAVGFGTSSHSDRLLKEVNEGCSKPASKKPLHLQNMAKFILDEPSHIGVSKMLLYLKKLVDGGVSGFEDIKFDYLSEYFDAIKIGSYAAPQEGFREISRIRSLLKPSPPARCISTIHKAKGLECQNALLVGCDRAHFSGSDYSIRKLYVAISRAKSDLTIVLSSSNPTPLINYDFHA